MEAINKRLSDAEFERERQEVLGMWPTGKEVDLDEAVEYQKMLLSKNQNYHLKVAEAKKNGTQLLRTDSGVAALDGEIELFQCLQNEGGADLLGTITDSFTRVLEFKRSEDGLKRSQEIGRTAINGYPIVVHGVKNTRKVIESVDLPIQLRTPAADVRLAQEIAFASGHTSSTGAPITAFFNFAKDVPLDACLHNYQYCYRLMASYQERGIPVGPEFGGTFPHIAPYSMVFTMGITQAIMAAEQGVKHIIFGIYGMPGNFAQDVAAIHTYPRLGEEYLKKLGYDDIEVSIMASCWGGVFPEDQAESFAVICLSAVTGMLGRAQIIHLKTIQESKTIPSKEANAASLRAGKKVINMMKDQSIELDAKAVASEEKMQEMETRAIIDRVLEMGDGDVIIGSKRAIEAGVIDESFAATSQSQGKVLMARDNEGAMRYLDHGNLPFSKEILEFHKEKLAEREKVQGRSIDYKNVIDDLLSISKGPLVTR